MNRIFDFTPSSEETVVGRILLLVHKAVDENFPTAEEAGRQFSKTLFSEDVLEKTHIDPSPEQENLKRPLLPPILNKDIPQMPKEAADFHEHVIPFPPSLPTVPPQKGLNFGIHSNKTPPAIPEPTGQTSFPQSSLKDPDPLNEVDQSIDAPPSDLLEDDEKSYQEDLEQSKDALESNDTEKKSLPLDGSFYPQSLKKKHPKKKKEQRTNEGEVDWVTRVTLSLLLAGLLLLVYVIFS